MAAHASESPPVITICPQCQLPLAVTAADLRIAQGQVRCGRCAAVFNALASLYDPGGASADKRAAALLEASRAAAAPAGSTATTAPASAAAPGGGTAAAPARPPAFWSPVGSSPFAPRRTDAAPQTREPAPPSEPAPAPAQQASLEPASAPATTTASSDTTILGPHSGLFRTPPRDDEPRFDDTHGADDWPPDLPEQLTAAAPTPAGLPAETTDTFRREPPTDGTDEPRTDALALPAAAAGPTASPELAEPARPTEAAAAVEPVELSRDWDIDTMTAAELAAMVASRAGDEPPELASIRIDVDADSEITVLPGGESLSLTAPDSAPDASLPRLLEPLADDPDLPGARAAAEERRTALPDAGLRWLELEPAAMPSTGSGAGPEAGSGEESGDRHEEEPAPGAFAALLEPDAAAGGGDPDRVRYAPAAAADLAATPDAAAGDALAEELVAGAPARPVTPRWMLGGTVALALLLVAQLVHRYREDLVEVPLLERPLTGLYASLGSPVQPRWDVGRYEVRQQGVVAEPVAAGTLTVRASIRNGAARAQPAPLLRVILQDRFGNRIATRDLTPREYGGTAALAPAPMLAPGQRIDAEVSLLDPGGDAVGFELDVCLRRPDTSVRCANDAPAANG